MDVLACLGPDGNSKTSPSLIAPASLPAVDRLDELLRWAEERAAAQGITPPYLEDGFSEESVMPPARVAAASSSGAEAVGVEGDKDCLDLPPLSTFGVWSGDGECVEPEEEPEDMR